VSRIAFLDIEASGLGEGSWPVQIGWSAPFDRHLDGEVLVRPTPDWTHWAPIAQARFHGIGRERLQREGIDPALVLDCLESELRRFEIYVSDPEHDRAWFARLVAAGGRPSCACTMPAPCSRLRPCVAGTICAPLSNGSADASPIATKPAPTPGASRRSGGRCSADAPTKALPFCEDR